MGIHGSLRQKRAWTLSRCGLSLERVRTLLHAKAVSEVEELIAYENQSRYGLRNLPVDVLEKRLDTLLARIDTACAPLCAHYSAIPREVDLWYQEADKICQILKSRRPGIKLARKGRL